MSRALRSLISARWIRFYRPAVECGIEGLTHRLVLRPPDGATTDIIAVEITTLIRAYLRGLRSDAA